MKCGYCLVVDTLNELSCPDTSKYCNYSENGSHKEEIVKVVPTKHDERAVTNGVRLKVMLCWLDAL